MNVLSEGDIYRLIVKSKLPTAVKFKRRVFDEVPPQIRKTGEYLSSHKKLTKNFSQDL
ncbi:BRO-N domain-containing protein [Clostridium lacusfryxellense]|uniref:BRO-N domain-containing protein n=1 Tax=Clostridium lacusfryxellense TaxID=205328 RepID=UPI001C0E674F|nr:BRO family protein [Clostridium lacusfryxellense]MBU3114625.1 hypothetical protein [Clostridium lacusfryxellense]